MRGSPIIVVTCFLVLQFSLFSAVDIWAMALPVESLSDAGMTREVSGMGMEHCQTAKKKQPCRCTGCTCVPLVTGSVAPSFLPFVKFDNLFPHPDSHFDRLALVPPFRPPIL